MASAQNNSGSYLTAARELAPRVAAAADDIDRERELPEKLFTELADNGFFRCLYLAPSVAGRSIIWNIFPSSRPSLRLTVAPLGVSIKITSLRRFLPKCLSR